MNIKTKLHAKPEQSGFLFFKAKRFHSSSPSKTFVKRATCGEKVRVFMRCKAQVLWDKTFAEDFGSLWHEAYFIPSKTDHSVVDLNDDPVQKIAKSVYK